ncbi:restriction endonuclease subunit M [Enterococcus faecium]|nr:MULTISPECIES: site-specific DNA-methyltransferase [Enterococcus]NTL95194.1 site-specific DNA-methyltransferase [Enterococcus faecium]OJT39726.1 restriction endonuclease subunit M [Enterococcus faecium]
MIKDTWDKNENASANKKEITVLKEHFPACFKEDGSFDIERFKEYLSEDINVINEGYELKFLGKNYARLLVTLETETVIVPNEEHNQKEENVDSENIYITGDNLDGLKHLLKSYAGKVKCIYIDPPYNTGSDGFVYNDNFNFTIEELTEKLSIGEEQAQRILDLTKRGSASHSAWLMFMYPRLQLARDLLSDDGVIFISIDDNEQANLKLLCDDIFGEENFETDMVWRKKTGASDSSGISTITESILVYCKNKNEGNIFSKNPDSFDPSRYKLEDEFIEERGPYYTDNLDRGGLHYSDAMNYSILAPDGTQIYPNGRTEFSNDGWTWKWSKEKVDWGIKNGFIVIEKSSRKKSGWAVKYKNYMNVDNEGRPIERASAYKNTIFDILNTKGTTEVTNLLGGKYFSNPKPSELIKYLINLVLDNELILDFFSGSATTADATMQRNAEDNGNRKFIMVQLPEKIKQGTLSYNKGYRTVDEIGRDRIIKAANKIKEENPGSIIDLGFKHFTLNEPTSETVNKLVEFNPDEDKLFSDRTVLDEFGVPTVITTWLNNDGYGLTTEAEKIMFASYEAYYKDKHLYLVHPELPNEAIEELVVKYETDGNFNPENIVLFGYSFTWTELESLKTNLKRLQDTEKNLRINFDVRY